MRSLYPAIEPFATGTLEVTGHQLYFERAGNPKGIPVVFLHGGPGAGCTPRSRQFFDPARYHIVLLDQRGAGRSTPAASLVDNTTWHLVADLELLRATLGIERWLVFGGSWGSTLALAYAETHPERVLGLVLRGIFMLRRSELLWFYQQGADQLFPDAFAPYRDFIPAGERGDLMSAYHRRLTGEDPELRLAAARQWALWEAKTSFLQPDAGYIGAFDDDRQALAFSRIECHYFVHGGFFDSDDQLLRNVGAIRHLPAVIVQGRYDVVCPLRSAHDLHQAWPEARLVIVGDAGHSAFEPGITSALIEATDAFANSLG